MRPYFISNIFVGGARLEDLCGRLVRKDHCSVSPVVKVLLC